MVIRKDSGFTNNDSMHGNETVHFEVGSFLMTFLIH
jgi:hypothetical protein